MSAATVEQHATLWLANDIPARMVYAGQRWRVSDIPTRLRHSNWTVPLSEPHTGLCGWRFQGTNDDGLSLVFDVYKAEDGWHVHRTYY
ncbi:hypothetical protein [Microbacterium sp. LWH11-1.2]|uniref:hypothetical protein n=1 Tax=unclassified Microbacterium TaxID=2609290 RepID=UPI003139D758